MFGALKTFHLATYSFSERQALEAKYQMVSENKGYAFAEFMNPDDTAGAIAGLHGLQVGDKTLTCRFSKEQNPSEKKPTKEQESAAVQAVVQAALAAANGQPVPAVRQGGPILYSEQMNE